MSYKILLHTPENIITVKEFADIRSFEGSFKATIGDIDVFCEFENKNGVVKCDVIASGGVPSECYISLYGKDDSADVYSFMEKCTCEHVLRQSPHDFRNYAFKMDKNTMPMTAFAKDGCADIFVSDNPAHCDNYTTQHIIPDTHEFYLSSGDPGGSPNYDSEFSSYYHKIGDGVSHKFTFIAVNAEAGDLKSIRKEAFLMIEAVWGNGTESVYRAMSFGGNYMHYRKNEANTSNYWIVPGIQYANCQYKRDSFYQSSILPVEMEEECYRAYRGGDDEASNIAAIKHAENPLFYVIWSCRIHLRGCEFHKSSTDAAVKFVMEHTMSDGSFRAECREHGDFRNWFDICCYEFDDVDAYTQGLFVCALKAAETLGYDIGDKYEKAVARYLKIYNGEFMPMSDKKQYFSLDVFVGDVLHYMLFGSMFVPDDIVISTYSKIMSSNAKTPYGTKIVSDKNGDFLPMEAYGAYGYVSPEMKKMESGRYANGGSYHLYEMLFHIDAYLHKAPGALENMKWRLAVDLDYDGTTHEYMHTVRGFGGKENQGWNAFIYKIWEELIERGAGDPSFFEFAEACFK